MGVHQKFGPKTSEKANHDNDGKGSLTVRRSCEDWDEEEKLENFEREKSAVAPEFIPSRMLDLNGNDRARCSGVAGGLKWQLRSPC